MIRRRIFALGLMALALVLGAVPYLYGREGKWGDWWADGFVLLMAVIAALKCLHTARELTGSDRRAWSFISAGSVTYVAAQLTWTIYDLAPEHTAPVPSPADVGYIAAPLLLMAGIGIYRMRTLSLGVTLAQAGNIGMIISAVFFVYLIPFYEFAGTSGSPGTNATLLTYMVIASSVFVFTFINVVFCLRGRRRLVMMPLLLSIGAIAFSNFAASVEYLTEVYRSSNFSNWGYVLALTLVCWAAFEQDELGVGDELEEDSLHLNERVRQWETLISPVAIAVIFIVTITRLDRIDAEIIPAAIGGFLLFITSVVLRDWWSQRIEAGLREETKRGAARLLESERRLLGKNRELAEVNRNLLREMTERTHVEEQLRHAHKLEAIGQLTGGVAHDFNNLLAVVLGNLELLERDLKPGSERLKIMREASGAAQRGAMLTRRLLSFSREQALNPRPVDAGALLEGMRDLLERTVSEAIKMRIQVPQGLWACKADPAQLESALLNLAINSRDAMSEGGELVLEASNLHLDERGPAQQPDALSGSFVAITVRDTGDGIDDAILDRVFEPFFSTKEVGAGSGLGLSMVYGFAKQSGGDVSITSVKGEGTEVRLCLPVTDLPVDSLESETTGVAPTGHGERVLVVEDDPKVRRLVVTLLEDLDYEPVAAGDACEALEILDRGEAFDLLLSDVVLPGETSGPTLGVEFMRRRPAARVLFMSGYAVDNLAYQPELRQHIVLLNKPFRKLELANKLREVLSSEPAPASDSE